MSARVVLFSIPGLCPLCDEARAVLESVAPGFVEVDIRTDRDLLRAFRNEIPVVTVDGRREFVGHVDPARLRSLLAARGGATGRHGDSEI